MFCFYVTFLPCTKAQNKYSHSKRELWGAGRNEWTAGRLEFIKETSKSYSSTPASGDHSGIIWAPKSCTAHSSAGLPEVHWAPLDPTLLSAYSFLQQKSHGPRFTSMLGTPLQPQFHCQLHTRTSGRPPSRNCNPGTMPGFSVSRELLYRPRDLLSLVSSVPVKPLSCRWFCQVLPATWHGAWPSRQWLSWLLYANSGEILS